MCNECFGVAYVDCPVGVAGEFAAAYPGVDGLFWDVEDVGGLSWGDFCVAVGCSPAGECGDFVGVAGDVAGVAVEASVGE